MKEAWGNKYSEWEVAYAQGVDANRVRAIEGAKAFTPNCVVVEVVDLGANCDRNHGLVLEEVQKAKAAELADFAVLYAAIQSPEWVKQIDSNIVPIVLVAALLLNVPGGDGWNVSPFFWHDGVKANLYGRGVKDRFSNSSMPILMAPKR